jgi:hypothetical protein
MTTAGVTLDQRKKKKKKGANMSHMTTAAVARDQRKKKKKKEKKADMTTAAVARDQGKKKRKSKHDHCGSRGGFSGSGSQPVHCSTHLSFALLLPAILRFRPTRPHNHCALPVLCTSSIV